MQACGPWAKARWRRALGARHVEAIGLRELRGVAVGGGDRDAHELAARDRRAPDLDIGGRVAIDERRGRLEAQRLLDRVGEHVRARVYARELGGMGEQVPDRVGDHALGRLDAAEQQHGGVGDGPLALEAAGLAHRGRQQGRAGLAIERRADRLRQRGVGVAAGVIQWPAGRDVGHRRDDPLIPAEHRRAVGVPDTERVRHDGDRQRPGERAAQLGVAGRRQRVDQVLGLVGDDLREARLHGTPAKRDDERLAVAAVLRPVETEHAGPDHLAGGEARVVDGERARVAHDLHREVAARDEPAVQRRQP